MKKSLILIALCMSSNSVFCQKNITEKYKTLKIAFINSSHIVIRNGLFNTYESKNSTSLINENGLITELREYEIGSSKTTVHENKYGLCQHYDISYLLNKTWNKIDTLQKSQIIFDNNCKIKEMIFYSYLENQIKPSHSTKYSYNENNKIKNISSFNEKGELITSTHYTYPNKLSVETKSFIGNSLWSRDLQYFDEQGNTIEHVSFDKSGNKSVTKTMYKYKNGKVIEEIEFDNSGKIQSKMVYFYNSNELIERTVRHRFEEIGNSETISIFKYIEK